MFSFFGRVYNKNRLKLTFFLIYFLSKPTKLLIDNSTLRYQCQLDRYKKVKVKVK